MSHASGGKPYVAAKLTDMTASPLVGYNTNIRHRGKLYHLQTEDSGVSRPHIITHLFADGGRIIASRKTGYAEHVGEADYKDTVKRLMREQHKAMLIELRDGAYDDDTMPSDAGQLYRAAVTIAPPVWPIRRAKMQSLFGAEVISDSSLDELIVGVLARDLSAED